MVSEPQQNQTRIAVVGGGITGLAAAFRLQELRPDWTVDLYERQDRLGGVIQTVQQDGFLMELGPDSFITQVPWGLDFCRRIGFEDELIGTNERFRKAYVVSGGRLHELPPGLMVLAVSRLWPLVTTPLVSLRGKLRAFLEVFIPPKRDGQDESLAQFARRRFGREVFERLMQPLASGIYMSDPERLSMQVAFPQYVRMEQQYGSLIRAARARAKKARQQGGGPRYSLFVTARRGLSSLVEAVRDKLPGVAFHLNTAVESLQKVEDGWELTATSGTESLRRRYAGVVLAVPASAAARLTASVDAELSTTLADIPASHCVIVTLAFDRSQVQHPLEGFGFVCPLVEGRQVVACTFSSVKFEGRAPADRVLLRAFLGGACRSDVVDWDDQRLVATALEELSELLGIRGEPLLVRVQRMPHTMPQYEVGHLERVRRIEGRLAELSGLQVAGNMLQGVGIPYCIHRGEKAAEALVEQLDRRTAGESTQG